MIKLFCFPPGLVNRGASVSLCSAGRTKPRITLRLLYFAFWRPAVFCGLGWRYLPFGFSEEKFQICRGVNRELGEAAQVGAVGLQRWQQPQRVS